MAKASTDYNPCVRGILYRNSQDGPVRIAHAASQEARSLLLLSLYTEGAILQDPRDVAEVQHAEGD